MRIAHYMQDIDFTGGGPPRAVIDQVATMHARGHQAGLLTTNVRDVPSSWLDGTPEMPEVVELPAVRGSFGRLSPEGLDRLRETIARFDILHMHGVWEPANLQVAAACRRQSVPYVVSLRGMLDDWSMEQSRSRKRVFLAIGGRRYLERAGAVHCTADAELEQSRKWFPRGTGVVVPNLIDLEPYADAPDPASALKAWPEIAESSFTVLFLSRIQIKKGLEHLIDAVAILRADGRADVRVIVAGTGDDDYVTAMRDRAKTACVADQFTWAGHVGGDLKNSLYAACDLFALPTSQENFGFVFFESLASGTPVVTTDLVDTCHEIERSGGGVIIPQNAERFADAIASFASGERDGIAMGTAGRNWTLENLDTSRVAAEFEAVYESRVGG
jgi:glycosyltransferase involved in cell wall biosynthesis